MPNLAKIILGGFATYKSNIVKSSLMTINYIILSMISILWLIFLLVNYPMVFLNPEA